MHFLNIVLDFINTFWAPIALLFGLALNGTAKRLSRHAPRKVGAKPHMLPTALRHKERHAAPTAELAVAILLSLAALGATGVLFFAVGGAGVWAKLGIATLLTSCSASCREPIEKAQASFNKYVKEPMSDPARAEKRVETESAEPSRRKKVFTLREPFAKTLNERLVAPLFWLVVLGFPGMAMYGTARSLAPSKESPLPPQNSVPLGAAKLNYILSYIPAWITTLFIYLAAGRLHALVERRRKASRKRDSSASLPKVSSPESSVCGDVGQNKWGEEKESDSPLSWGQHGCEQNGDVSSIAHGGIRAEIISVVVALGLLAARAIM